jgi:hypothetical protein
MAPWGGGSVGRSRGAPGPVHNRATLGSARKIAKITVSYGKSFCRENTRKSRIYCELRNSLVRVRINLRVIFATSL